MSPVQGLFKGMVHPDQLVEIEKSIHEQIEKNPKEKIELNTHQKR